MTHELVEKHLEVPRHVLEFVAEDLARLRIAGFPSWASARVLFGKYSAGVDRNMFSFEFRSIVGVIARKYLGALEKFPCSINRTK